MCVFVCVCDARKRECACVCNCLHVLRALCVHVLCSRACKCVGLCACTRTCHARLAIQSGRSPAPGAVCVWTVFGGRAMRACACARVCAECECLHNVGVVCPHIISDARLSLAHAYACLTDARVICVHCVCAPDATSSMHMCFFKCT